MGINVGDIIRDGRDIYGDGVNVAGRLERVRCRLSAGGKWIRTSGSARDCIMVEVGSRASPGQSSSPAARPRLERAANGGSLGFAPGRDPAASPERAHRIPAKRCFRTRCVSTDLSPGPHTRGKTRALPPCFYRRHRAHSPASLTGRFDLPVGTERARAHRPRLSPIGFPVRQSCCPAAVNIAAHLDRHASKPCNCWC